MQRNGERLEVTPRALRKIGQKALREVQGSLAWGERAGLLFAGVSLGSILLLAALGLEVLTVLALAQWTALGRWTGAPVPTRAAINAAIDIVRRRRDSAR